MKIQEELLEKTRKKEDPKLNDKVKELSRQYKSGEISKMDVLVAIKDILTRFN